MINLTCCFLLFGLVPSAAAQTGINITPTNLAPTIAIGDETREKVTLRNSSAGDIEVEASIEQPALGKGAMLIETDSEPIRLKPGEARQVEVRIIIPAEAGAGTQQGSVTFNVGDAKVEDVAIVGKIRVGVKANIIQPISDAGFSYPLLISSSGPVAFTMRGRNTSDFPTTITATVELGSLLGDDIVLRQSSGLIDNDASFDMQAVWPDPPLIAIRKMTISLTSGVGTPVTKSRFIMIVSWKLLLAAALLAAGAIILLRKLPAIANVFRR